MSITIRISARRQTTAPVPVDKKWPDQILAPDGRGGYRVATIMRSPEHTLARERQDGNEIREGRP